MSQDGSRGSKPELKLGSHLVPGLAAVALFAVMAVVFLRAEFPLAEAAGFPEGASITASIGYAMFNVDGGGATVPSEGFLVAFEIVDIVLVAALVGAVTLARTGIGSSITGVGSEKGPSKRRDGGRD